MCTGSRRQAAISWYQLVRKAQQSDRIRPSDLASFIVSLGGQRKRNEIEELLGKLLFGSQSQRLRRLGQHLDVARCEPSEIVLGR
jgi:hypothetical protein